MERPIISCDVSKGSSHIRGFIGLSNPVGNPFVVRHIKSAGQNYKCESFISNSPLIYFDSDNEIEIESIQIL